MRAPRPRSIICIISAALIVGSAAPAQAQTNVWTGGGTTGDWSNGSNWISNTAPTSGATNDLLFVGSSNLNTNQNIANPFDLNALTYDTSAGAFVTFGQTLRFVANGATAPSLVLNNASPITFNNPVTFNATGSIGGTGTSALTFGPLTVGAGTLSIPRNGVSAGTLTVPTGATLSPASPTTNFGTLTVGAGGATFGGTYAADIGTGTSSDLLAITGALTLSPGSTLTLSGTASGGTYTLANYASRTGTFTTVNNLPANYQLVYGATSLQLVAVPEPAMILALCAAGAGVVGWYRRDDRSRRRVIA